MGKREEKKKLLKEKILKAAREVFLFKGYDNTTIGDIAEKAGVGLGTAYNYFDSKEDIFLLAMAEEIADDSQDISDEAGCDVDEKTEEQPADIITEMVLKTLRKLNFFGKKIWRVTLAATFRSMKSNEMIIHQLVKADYRMMEKIKIKLEEFKSQGKLAEDIEIETAVELIYGSVMLHLMMYVYTDHTFEEISKKIRKNICFVLNLNRGGINDGR